MTGQPTSGQRKKAVTKRFIILMVILTVVMFTVWTVISYMKGSMPGDYEVRQGDILMRDKKYDQALERFAAALAEMPNHRGALMGRAVIFLGMGRDAEAEAELTYLIDFLEVSLEPDDLTGIGTLAAAYGNRGILYDRLGQYEKALNDYIEAIRIDKEGMEGPGLIDKLLYSQGRTSSVLDRARYLYEQFQNPESERVFRIPELDERQFMYKP